VTMNFLGLAILGYSWQVSGYVSVDTHSIRILVEFSRIQVSGYPGYSGIRGDHWLELAPSTLFIFSSLMFLI
jgi:hypothetical protein